ncbi:signal peptide peptidase SppA [Methanobacterium formicicum]|jgi:protease-4|uniref:Signal peptide peptidase SppA, 36K type n=1 Tax=Methanobacterium formicicum TaxID=2162 RepID=A0A089ZEP7_METFO|nr:signal peptide peptidase SppA [Methanobacterium formicicum]AIS32512.1 signal peptide peptidase SppA2 [Methanobacterium formicicum]CEL24299.1 signal peptide peptidase SppA, 36K type [Methanobacterium formicicum]
MDKNAKILLLGVGGLSFLVVLAVAMLVVVSSSWGGTVAVIPIQGEIGYSSSNVLGGGVVNPDVVKEQIRSAEDDGSVGAILLEINSPGGTPVASEEIMNEVRNSKKPVVSWISDSGASGAYLAATGSDKIVASNSSMVGSIGVIMDLTNLSDLYEKLGINRSSIKAGKYKDMGADYRDLTPEEQSILQVMVNENYDNFISIVAENRNLTHEYVASIAEGRIYTGKQAKDLKLIDEVGGKDEALDLAARLGGIPGSYKVVTMSSPQSFDDILSSLSSKLGYSIGKGMGSLLEDSNIQSARY